MVPGTHNRHRLHLELVTQAAPPFRVAVTRAADVDAHQELKPEIVRSPFISLPLVRGDRFWQYF